jgi:multidrug efflux system membrane fusion protein
MAAAAWIAQTRGLINIAWLRTPNAAAPAAKVGEQAVPVVAVETRYADVPVRLDAVGTVQALNMVLIRSQVDGRLMQLAVKEGENVQRGDLIARVDPVIYQAAYEQAVAKKIQDEANLANAKVDLERFVTLLERGFGPRVQAETQRALVAQLTALVRADQAAIDNAKAILSYTTIHSPIDGRAGIRLVDEGNLIRTADAAGIVTITQIQPISLIVNLPQQQFRTLKEAMLRGSVKVQALDADSATPLGEGVVDVIDNQVDQATGTVKIRARFPNDDLVLWPGQFVNVRIFTDMLKHVAVIPAAAVQRGPDGPFVYRAGEDGKAALTPIVVVRQDGQIAVVASGVTPPDRVITSGFQRLADQTRVKVSPPSTSVSLRKDAEDGTRAGQ